MRNIGRSAVLKEDTVAKEHTVANGNTVAKRVAALVASMALVWGLAGCQSSSKEPSATDSTSAGASASEPASESPAGGTDPSDQPSSTQVFTDMGEDFRGILADVTTEACPTTKGKVTAKGTVVNSAKEAADIFIGVIWLKPDSGDSVAMKEWTAKNVAPGDTVEWSVDANLSSKPGRCVLQAKANKAGTLK